MQMNPFQPMNVFWMVHFPGLVSLLADAIVLVVAWVVYRRTRLSALKWAVALRGVLLLSRALGLVTNWWRDDILARFHAAAQSGQAPQSSFAQVRSMLAHQASWQSGIAWVVMVLSLGLTITFLLVLMHDIQKLQAAARPPAPEPPVSNVA
jgi:flagellar biogenesis protein FliO